MVGKMNEPTEIYQDPGGPLYSTGLANELGSLPTKHVLTSHVKEQFVRVSCGVRH